MAIASDLHATYRDAARARGAADPATAWFQPERMAALERFIGHGFPTAREEDWKYTDLGDLDRRAAALLAAPLSARAPATGRGGLLDASEVTLTLLNGAYAPGLSTGTLPGGLRLRRLRDLTDANTLVGKGGAHTAALADLNAGLLCDVLALEIAPGIRLDEPIRIVVTNDLPGVFASRLLVSLGRGAAATLIEHHTGATAAISNTVTRMSCGKDSELDYLRLQQDDSGAVHLSSQECSLEDGASVHIASLDLGAALARSDLTVNLAGRGSRSDVSGLILADASRHVDNHTRFDHRGRDATSRTHYRSIGKGKSRAVFNGKIVVHPGAGGTDAELRNANLLLSPDAEVDTKPELEIYADEVKCSHGATTGQLDDQAIFYLRSRGIALSEARRLLIEAFAQEIRRGIRNDRLRSAVSDLLAARLIALGLSGEAP